MASWIRMSSSLLSVLRSRARQRIAGDRELVAVARDLAAGVGH